MGTASLLGACSGSCGPVYDGKGPWGQDAGADAGGAGEGDGGDLDAGHGMLAAQHTELSVSIDGQLNEAGWRIESQLLRAIEGASANDVRFATLWDSRYLYVGFRILDAQLTTDSSEAHQDDSVEVYLDPDLSRSSAYDAHDRQFIVGINRSELFEARGNTAGVLHASALIPGGYSVELAIPWANLGMTPTSGMTLGFDVQNNDDDDGGARDGALGWHSADNRNWTDTSGFGELQLVGGADGGVGGGTGGGGGSGGAGGGTGGGASASTTWVAVPIRTKAQETAGYAGGEGMQQNISIAYAPSNPNIVYKVTDTSAVWRSTDSGTTWHMRKNGFRALGGVSVAVSPVDENVVLVAGGPPEPSVFQYSGVQKGIYRTTNGGGSWLNVLDVKYYSWGPDGVIAFANGGTVYAGTHGNGLYKSTNAGSSWEAVALTELTNDEISGVQTFPGDPQTLLVASSSDRILYRVTGGGTGVERVGAGLPAARIDAVEIASGGLVYVTVGNSGCYRSVDGGRTFSPRNGTAPNSLPIGRNRWEHFAMSPRNPNRLFAAMAEDVGMFHSSDGGANWYRTQSSDEYNADGWVVGSMGGWYDSTVDRGLFYLHKPIAPHPRDELTALSVNWTSGISKTTDGGVHWRFSSAGYTGGAAGWVPWATEMSSIRFDRRRPDRFALFLADMGVFLTENAGSTFRFLDVPINGGLQTSAGDLDSNADTVITAVGGWESKAIAITLNASSPHPTWKLLPATTASYAYSFIALHPTNSNVAYAERYRFDNILTSDVYVTLPKSVRAMFPGDGDVVYAFEYLDASNTKIYRSDDRGSTWTDKVHSSPQMTYANIPADIRSGLLGQIAIDPKNRDRLYAATLSRGVYVITGSSVELWSEANGLGRSWFGSVDARYVAIDPRNTNVVYVGYNNQLYGLSMGVLRSIDAGRTFENITYNLGPEFSMAFLTVNPNDGYVYLGSTFGTWRLPPP